MSTPDRFGAIADVLDVARGVARDIDLWSGEYLAALLRQRPDLVDLGPAPLNPAVVRHAGIWRPQEATPAVVVWIEDDRDYDRDPDRAAPMVGTVEVSVAIVVSTTPEHLATLLHAYVAVVRKLLLDRRTAGGVCRRLVPTGADHAGIDSEERGDTLAQSVLTFDAVGVSLGVPGAGPPIDADPRDDPSQPWPPLEHFETADLTTLPTRDPRLP